jgi:hypothetical protein
LEIENANMPGKMQISKDYQLYLKGRTLKCHGNGKLKGKTLKCHDNPNLKGRTQI